MTLSVFVCVCVCVCVRVSAAGECPVWGARVMAQYAPQANALSDEQEYLQAYEDVLEKYKGRISTDWVLF